MSPHEIDKMPELFPALAKLGWTRKEQIVDHERDNASWTEQHWCAANGRFLFSEDDLGKGLALELIRIAAVLAPPTEVTDDRSRPDS